MPAANVGFSSAIFLLALSTMFVLPFAGATSQSTSIAQIVKSGSTTFDTSNSTWARYVHIPERFALGANASWSMEADNDSVTFYLVDEKSLIVYVQVAKSYAFQSLDDAVKKLRNFCGGTNTQSCSVSEPGQLKVGSVDAYEFIIEEIFAYRNVRDVARRSIIAVERASDSVYLAIYYVFTETVQPQPAEKVPQLARAVYDKYHDQASRSLSSLRFVVKTSISIEGVPKDLNPSVTVDGVPYSNLPITSWLEHGSNHTLSVQPILPSDSNTTRYSFQAWSNGSGLSSQTVTIEPDDPKGLSYVATFCTEYLLTVRSELGSPEGGGWFQSGIATTVRVASSIPMSGIMGFLGGKWVFDGWYQDGVLVSNSNEAQILVDKPYALEARWSADYTIPTMILVLVVAFLVSAACAVAYRKNALRRQATTAVT